MRYSIYLLLLLSIIMLFINCDNPNISSKKGVAIKAKSTPVDWENAFQQATSFNEETTLLTTLIKTDSANIYQQLIANRLQTFDLRHLNEAEKLTIINLYAASLAPEKQPSSTILQIAQAKLNTIYPTNNELVDKRIMEVIKMIH